MIAELSVLIRYSQLVRYLRKLGLTESTVRSCIKDGIIRSKTLRPGARGWYSARQVCNVLRRLGTNIHAPKIPEPRRFHPYGTKRSLLPYGLMRDWLAECGIPECEVLALKRNKHIRAVKLRVDGWDWYSAAQIRRDVLRRLL